MGGGLCTPVSTSLSVTQYSLPFFRITAQEGTQFNEGNKRYERRSQRIRGAVILPLSNSLIHLMLIGKKTAFLSGVIDCLAVVSEEGDLNRLLVIKKESEK